MSAGRGPSRGVSRGGKGPPGPQHCACCGGGLLWELVPVDRDELSGNNCGCPLPQPFPGNLPAWSVSNATPVCRISTAVRAPRLIRLHNTPRASCPTEGPGERDGARTCCGMSQAPPHPLSCGRDLAINGGPCLWDAAGSGLGGVQASSSPCQPPLHLSL